MSRRMVLGLVLAVLVVLPVAHLPAQQLYQLQMGSVLSNGCLGPSPCDCLEIQIGEISGTYVLQIIPPPLGPIFEYDVLDIDWTVIPDFGLPVVITGAGSYTIDVVAATQVLDLDLIVDGIPQNFETYGFLPASSGYPGQIDFQVYRMIDSCIYDGITITSVPGIEFRRGDCNADGNFDIADPISTLVSLFTPGPAPWTCPAACDSNDDGAINIADPVYSLLNLFTGGPDPNAPFPGCGLDPTPPPLDCMSYAPCP